MSSRDPLVGPGPTATDNAGLTSEERAPFAWPNLAFIATVANLGESSSSDISHSDHWTV